ncbi:hypothetical protein ACIA6C_28000 [Streptomyces sp. NPDC051578]|uniref:hypothetical protein n=1 Tax=Streptomyces sp. NPDC051578 TaxID=3365662 RepID=UPI0037ABF1AA
MIEFMPRSGPPEAMHCATVICDACRQQVHGAGNLVWGRRMGSDETGKIEHTPLFAAHKGACDRALDNWLKKQYPQGQWLLMWEELGDFLKQLAYNSEHAFTDDTKGEYHKTILKMPSSDLHAETPTFDPQR